MSCWKFVSRVLVPLAAGLLAIASPRALGAQDPAAIPSSKPSSESSQETPDPASSNSEQVAPTAAGDDTADPAQEESAAPPALDQESLDTLHVLAQSLEDLQKELARKRAELSEATGADVERITGEIRALQAEIRQDELSLDAVATGLDMAALGAEADENFSLREELETLLRPILRELKAATEDPRRIDQLENEVEFYTRQKDMIDVGLKRIELFKARTDPRSELYQILTSETQEWQSRRNQIQNQITVTRHQLQKKLENRKSLLESSQSIASEFFRSRGLNLISSLGTFVLVFVGLRYLYFRLLRVSGRTSKSFFGRLITVLFFFCAFLAAVFSALLVLYVAGDWVLLGLALILLLGLAWTSRQALPHVMQDIRMLVNLGPVRENERLVLDGVPWHVKSLNVYTTLHNPMLTGGLIRLPVRTLSSLHSRPMVGNEIWFPSRVDDWVQLGDGRRGKVAYQSPEFVQLIELGGARVTYSTSGFLSLNPRNLSTGFRLSETFGVDYQHQADCTDEIPEVMKAALSEELEALVDPAHLKKVNVEFKEAGASSLDYAAIVDLDGALAPRFDELRRAMARILVDACNRHGWVIPFTQITVHQAESTAESTTGSTAE